MTCKHISALMVLLLLVFAGRIFFGLLDGENMWLWIATYWLLLMIKNAVDCLEEHKK